MTIRYFLLLALFSLTSCSSSLKIPEKSLQITSNMDELTKGTLDRVYKVPSWSGVQSNEIAIDNIDAELHYFYRRWSESEWSSAERQTTLDLWNSEFKQALESKLLEAGFTVVDADTSEAPKLSIRSFDILLNNGSVENSKSGFVTKNHTYDRNGLFLNQPLGKFYVEMIVHENKKPVLYGLELTRPQYTAINHRSEDGFEKVNKKIIASLAEMLVKTITLEKI